MTRQKNKKRDCELDKKHASDGKPMESAGQVMREPAENSRKINHRNSQTTPVEKLTRIARKPASSKKTSHWNCMKTCPTETKERYKIKSVIRLVRGRRPNNKRIAKTMPNRVTTVKAAS